MLPLPGAGDAWDPHTVHTHYFGFSVPEAAIGAFLYVRYMPVYRQCHGGVAIFRGLDNVCRWTWITSTTRSGCRGRRSTGT